MGSQNLTNKGVAAVTAFTLLWFLWMVLAGTLPLYPVFRVLCCVAMLAVATLLLVNPKFCSFFRPPPPDPDGVVPAGDDTQGFVNNSTPTIPVNAGTPLLSAFDVAN